MHGAQPRIGRRTVLRGLCGAAGAVGFAALGSSVASTAAASADAGAVGGAGGAADAGSARSPAGGAAPEAEKARAPLLVMVAPNGSSKTKKDHPALPLSPEEIGRTAAACREAGAAMIHLHVRDADGKHTLDPGAYRPAIVAIRKQAGERIVIQATTEAVGRFTPAQQMALVREIRPESASLALKELIPDDAALPAGAEFLKWVAQERILAQYIVYSPEELKRYQEMRDRGVVPEAPHLLLFVLGRYSPGQVSTPADLLPFLAVNKGDVPWVMTAFGKEESACALAAGALGGHARVGFENNLFLADGRLAPDNAALVAQVRAGAKLLGRPLMDAAALRKLAGR
jgi:3-keto-5-aminohexanoate cleavage enzyme